MARIMCNFFSYSLGHGVDIEVTLPSFTSCNMEGGRSHKLPGRFPVLYLLHGHGNDYAVWHRYTSVDRYAEEKRIAIVTFSVGNKPYSNEPGGDNFYDFLEQELPDFLENYFPISGDPKDRYIAGLSMGGYGALLHGLENPERYRAIGAFSPAVFSQKQLEENPRGLRLKDLYAVTEKALAGRKVPDLFLCIGDKDFLYGPVTEYHDFLKRVWTGARLRYDDMPGYEHEFAIWDLEVSSFLDWIPREDVFKQMGPNKV